MGMIHHHAVVATTWNAARFGAVLEWIAAEKLAERFVNDPAVINSYRTIVLFPDGSKEGWDESNTGDQIRAKFIARLKQDNYEDGSSPWDFAEVGFGELGAAVVSTNCENRYDTPPDNAIEPPGPLPASNALQL